ncbi:MAG TPA: TetR/AcrR family transcriptional regulator [Vicinamibacterales bacterium]|nr:TetR/AcrR family transcriptional regulator [Vicinamibacterales bacterium]
MAGKERATRELMLEAAETLLRERGLAGAGIQQVIARSGAPIGSLYHFFPGGKTQLVAEALRINSGKAGALFRSVLSDTSASLPDRVRRFFRTASSGFDRMGADKGCAIGSVALDLDARHEALRVVCQEAFDAWTASIADELPWSDAATRRGFAEMLIAGLEGAFILGRARRSGEPFITVGEWLALMLERRPPHARVRAGARSPRRRQRRSNRRR